MPDRVQNPQGADLREEMTGSGRGLVVEGPEGQVLGDGRRHWRAPRVWAQSKDSLSGQRPWESVAFRKRWPRTVPGIVEQFLPRAGHPEETSRCLHQPPPDRSLGGGGFF